MDIESFLGCWILMLEVDAIGVVLIPYLGGTVPNSNFYSTYR